MDVHIRVRRWVVWWFYASVAFGATAIANILGRDLTRRQDRILLFLGVIYWVLGGLVSFACDSIRIETPGPPPAQKAGPSVRTEALKADAQREWHVASDFLLPGGRKSLLPPKY
jgi:hypothetical protein